MPRAVRAIRARPVLRGLGFRAAAPADRAAAHLAVLMSSCGISSVEITSDIETSDSSIRKLGSRLGPLQRAIQRDSIQSEYSPWRKEWVFIYVARSCEQQVRESLRLSERVRLREVQFDVRDWAGLHESYSLS